MKKIIELVLFALILFLGYMLWDSIMEPIRFNKSADWRKELTVQKLKDIRNAQVAFKSQRGHYAGNFDTLIDFIKNGKIKIVKAIGNIPDSFYNKYPRKLAEEKAIEAGIVKRDTLEVSCYDSLCANKYTLDSLAYVPKSNNVKFELGAVDSLLTGSGVTIPVFECKTPYEVYLQGLDRQEIINKIDEAETLGRYPGLKVGSLTEYNNNAGNWE
ncbi:MAG: hypothetical protein IKQ46_14755 [Bacteroidales bacterium]|jgi:hypothetical protein|nr:hypothetical protein [Bacteroidales bacterium]